MKHIGSGWQFDAYATNGRVLKKPTSPIAMAARVVRSYPALLAQPLRLTKKVAGLRADRDAVLTELASRDVDLTLLANFRMEGGEFLQDRVLPIDTVLASGRDPFWIADRYVESICRGWQAGIAETSFNFTVNHGVTERGHVVIIDVGEITFDRRDVARLIQTRFWEAAYSVAAFPAQARDYLLRRMARELTFGRLERTWKDARYKAPARLAPDRVAVHSKRKQPFGVANRMARPVLSPTP